MFKKLKNLFRPTPSDSKKQPLPKDKKTQAKREPVVKPVVKPVSRTPKEIATAAGEPYVNVIGMEIDPMNISSGSFELDFNPKFVVNLVKAGYMKRKDDTDNMIVDRWFQEICRNIALETYEQSMADPDNRVPPLTKVTDIQERVIANKPLGDGRSEIS